MFPHLVGFAIVAEANVALDANIILGGKAPQFDDPLTVQNRQATLAALMGRQQLQQMEMEGAQRQRKDEQTLADLYRSTGTDPQALMQGMAQQGLGARIPAFQKQQADIGKAITYNDAAKLKLAQERIKIVGARISSRLANPNVTQQEIIQDIIDLQEEGIIDKENGARLARGLTGNPRQDLLRAGMELMSENERINLALGKTTLENRGGFRQGMNVNQITGQVTQVGPELPNTATPGEVMTDARTRSEGAANRGVTMRGQNMTDDRARDLAQATRDAATTGAGGKPLPPVAVKLQNNALQALGSFKSVDADLAALEQQITDGKLQVGPVNRALGYVRTNTNQSTENDRNIAALKTKLEGMRNAILLMGKGVQTEGDAQRALEEILSNLNDQALLKQRLPELRAKLQRDAGLQKSQVELLRSNYGAEPLDFAVFEQQPASVNLPTAGGGAPVQIKSDADYNALKPGTRFVTPDGKTGTKR